MCIAFIVCQGTRQKLYLKYPLRAVLVRMKAFEVSGQLMTSHRRWTPFAIEVAAADESAAREKTLALMGSRHKVKRKFVQIEGIKSLRPEEITDHLVKHLVEAKK